MHEAAAECVALSDFQKNAWQWTIYIVVYDENAPLPNTVMLAFGQNINNAIFFVYFVLCVGAK